MKTFKLDKNGMFNDFHSAIAGFFMFIILMSIIFSPLANEKFEVKNLLVYLFLMIFLALSFYLHKYKNKSFLIYFMELLTFAYLIFYYLF
jgi:hypothetical protein